MRYIKTAVFVLIPSLANYLFLSIFEKIGTYTYVIFPVVWAPFYLLTIVYILVFILKKFDKPAILSVSLALTPASAFIFEYLIIGRFQSVTLTFLTAFYYALPLTLITAIAALVIAHKKRKNGAH